MGIVPPPIAAVSAAVTPNSLIGFSTLWKGVSSHAEVFAGLAASVAAAALGAPPPDDSLSPHPTRRGAEESVSPALYSLPDLGLDRRPGFLP